MSAGHVTEAHMQRWIPAEVRAGYPIALPDMADNVPRQLSLLAETR